MDPVPEAPIRERLLSLDVFRGLAVIGMMLVDWPGNWDTRYALFEHSAWSGVTAADFIFPAFLFIMGVSIPFSLLARRDAGERPSRLYGGILRRALLLFLLGYFLNLCWYASPRVLPIDWSHLRLLGVLQRFALVYPVVAIAALHLSPRQMAWMGAAILVSYWALMTRVPVPGFGPPDLLRLPQGEMTPNLATWLDKTILGPRIDAFSYPYDPEGILSTLPSVATGLLGAITGLWIRRRELPLADRLNGIFAWGVALVVAGCFWSLGFPLCKKLWSSSFVLFMGGWSLLFLGALTWIIDVKGRTGNLLALPQWFGVNALAGIVSFTFLDNVMSRLPVGLKADKTAYALKDFLNDHLFRSFLSDRNASWVYSCVAILGLSLLFRLLHHRKWYFRV
jgi:predicted acyltransferase